MSPKPITKRILFLYGCDIENPMRGTPIRIAAILKQLKCVDDFSVKKYCTRQKKIFTKLKELREREEEIFFGNTHLDLFTLLISKLFLKKKIIIDIHGALEEELYLVGRIPKIQKRLLGWIYKQAFRFFDLISVVNSKLKYQFQSVNRSIVVTYPGYEPKNIPTLKERARTERVLILSYVGNARAYQGIDSLIHVIKRLRSENFSFRFQIISSEKRKMRDLLIRNFANQDTSWINERYNLQHHEALYAISESDILFILRPKNPVTMLSFPAKLPEYLATGKTSLISKISDVDELLEHGKHAYLIDPDDREEQTYTILKGLLTRQLPLLNAQTVHTFAEKRFTWQRVCEPLINAINEL